MTFDPINREAATLLRGRTNRLPPNKHEVTGCNNCPLRADLAEDETSKCQHPYDTLRDVTGIDGVPDFCPLVRAPLLLHISEVAHD